MICILRTDRVSMVNKDLTDIEMTVNGLKMIAHVKNNGDVTYDVNFRLDSVLHSLMKDMKEDDDPVEYVTGIWNREFLDWTMRKIAMDNGMTVAHV